MAIYSILQEFNLDFLHPHGVVAFGPKVVGTLGHANVLGGYLAMIFPFGLVVYRFTRTFSQKIFTMVSLMAIISALLLTQSRGAWLALTCNLLIFNFRVIKTGWQRVFNNQIFFLIALTGLIICGAVFFFGY